MITQDSVMANSQRDTMSFVTAPSVIPSIKNVSPSSVSTVKKEDTKVVHDWVNNSASTTNNIIHIGLENNEKVMGIFTDASVHIGKEYAGIAAVKTTGEIRSKFIRQSPDRTVESAELKAIEMGIDFINPKQEKKWVISSDSKTSVDALNHCMYRMINDIPPVLRDKRDEHIYQVATKIVNFSRDNDVTINIVWMKGHIDGNPYNRAADKLAKLEAKFSRNICAEGYRKKQIVTKKIMFETFTAVDDKVIKTILESVYNRNDWRYYEDTLAEICATYGV